MKQKAREINKAITLIFCLYPYVNQSGGTGSDKKEETFLSDGQYTVADT